MPDTPLSQRTAQLDNAEREQLEAVVAEMRERVEANVRFQLTQFGLDTQPSDDATLDTETRQLVDAIELEAVDGADWDDALTAYVDGVGYTIVNRLAALRCMEVRGFLDEEVTVFKETGLTPAAETLVHEEFLLEDEAILAAYHNTCDELATEIEILFDRSSAYSLLDPDDDTFADLCGMLDDVPDAVWRADDVLGWVYEYYNRPVVEALDAKNTLEASDVGPANQFYTPHWVVRMLTDNSLGKLYLEATDRLSTVPEPDERSVEARKSRLVTPEAAPSIAELCTYLIPDADDGEAPDFEDPSELRVIDPACGSGHFLLYAFDVLERIWWAERPDLDRAEIPARILEHNLYGVDIDLRSCQLTAFNLYLKARTRAEAEDTASFEMPNIGIVCADARVTETEAAVDILTGISGEETELREALDSIIEEFQTTAALGSLLNVQGTLSEAFMESQTDIMEWGGEGPHTLTAFLKELRAAVDERAADSFGAQNLRSFLHLLVVLTQEYDVALMNPPYGSRGRMPDDVQTYIQREYEYTPEYYINFFEACDRLTTAGGRIGMLVPWSFMFNRSFDEFREDFVGTQGSFDFFAEFGYDVLDNATVGTVGTVVRTDETETQTGTFIRLHDVETAAKEETFINAAFGSTDGEIQRRYERTVSEFSLVPGAPLSYWVPADLRSLYDSEAVLDTKRATDGQHGLGDLRQGLATGDDGRFLRSFWESSGEGWVPFAKGGADAWLLPRITNQLYWGDNGTEVRRYSGGNGTPSEELYFEDGLTYTVAKRSGRRFGYFPEGSIFGHKGSVFVPDRAIWNALSYTNSHLFTYLMLTQTSERMWEVGFVANVPWRAELEAADDLEALAREAVGHLVSKRQYDFVSPHYNGPVLLALLGVDDQLQHYDHPHRDLREGLTLDTPAETLSAGASLDTLGTEATRHLERIEAELQSCADAIDDAVFECFEITDDQRETVLQEIALRTIEDPRDRETYDPDSITEPGADFPELVKDLLLHLTLRIVQEDRDGIVPLSAIEGEAHLLDRIEAEFERVWGDHAAARLAEVDAVLGSRSADQAAYPNLRAWLEDDLFEYHVSTFDRTPIVWRLTTDRLVSDPNGEGFGCLVDYHQLDGSVFDRLQNRYLEPRKALLRERRSAANRRRGDDTLSSTQRAGAVAAAERAESGLEQIDVFEDRLAELAQPTRRVWPDEPREIAREATEDVAAFREAVDARLSTLDELAAIDDVNMAELFSPSFYETVQSNREEWLAALDDLEAAFEVYSRDGSEPIEAHLYDRFEYYDDLIGSTHYASNGILFMNYYFDRFDDESQGAIDDEEGSTSDRLCARLAQALDDYEALAAEIATACDAVVADSSDDWADRARAEITTAGYRPNRKHGVAINIAPLADAEIVPKIVDKIAR